MLGRLSSMPRQPGRFVAGLPALLAASSHDLARKAKKSARLIAVFATTTILGFVGAQAFAWQTGIGARVAYARMRPVGPPAKPGQASDQPLGSAVASGSKVSVFSTPSAHVFLDGHEIGKTPLEHHATRSGRLRLRLVSPGQPEKSRELEVEVLPGNDLRVTYDFRTGRSSMLAIAP